MQLAAKVKGILQPRVLYNAFPLFSDMLTSESDWEDIFSVLRKTVVSWLLS